MKKFLFLIACMLNTILASAQYSGSGNGTEDDPYLIYNETQLYQMNNFLGSDHVGVVFKLMKDLDLADFISDNFPSEGWMPIGVESTPFEGKFYGNNHKLSGLWINRTSTNNVGLFGYTTNATIQDLTIEESSIKANNYVGSVVGQSISSTISNCSVTASSGVSGGGSIGGIIGNSTSTTISQCSYNGTITETATSCGGIVGYITNGLIMSSKATSTITGTTNVGGVAGYDYGANITDCKMNGDINGSSNVGGIVGAALSIFTISNSKYVGDVKGSSNIAGVAGSLQAGSSITFDNSHSKGNITNTGDYTGGIVGVCNGGCIAGMEDCSHFGDINGKNYVGGIIGSTLNKSFRVNLSISSSNTSNDKIVTTSIDGNYSIITANSKSYQINNCVAIGNLNGNKYIGGLVGEDKGFFAVKESGTDEVAVISLTGYYAYTTMYLWIDDTYSGSSIFQNSPSARFNWSIGRTTCTYFNSYYSGIINGMDNVGGITGYKWCGKIQNCYTNATVYGNKNVGGIIGNAEGCSTSTLTLKSDVAINNAISATEGNIGRIYGTKNDYLTIGALGSAEGNRALTTTKVIKQGVVQEVADDLQNGNVMGKSLLKLKANYVALGWDFDNNWDILETECYPYKKYQAAPPVIESNLVSQDTEISGSSLNGGTVYLYYKDRDAVSTTCSGNAWSFTTEKLQSGAAVQLYADVDGMTPSYLTSATVGYPGSGTEADPYRIYTAEDLQGASNKGYYKLMNDINLTTWINENSPTEGWVSIGRNSGEATYINGDGHKVKGLWINTTQDYTGLFSNFSAGIIKNLTVEVASGKKVKGGDYTGVLIGRNTNGQIVNCIVKGDVEGTKHVGGVTGYTENSTLTSNSYEGKVASTSDNAFVGGIAGLSKTVTVASNKATATISASGTSNCVGGLFGKTIDGSIIKSVANTTLTALGANDSVGGLVGYSSTPISLCYTKGTVSASGDNSYTGGLVGYSVNTVENCYSNTATTGFLYTAGLVGYTTSTIDKCYAKGNVNGVMYGAGVVGELDGSSAALTNSVAANDKLDLSAQTSWGCRVIGGFKNGCTEPTIGSNLALSSMQVSLNGVAQKKTDDNIEGVATAEADLMTVAKYTSLGWDMTNTWAIDEGKAYPYLLWENAANPVADISLNKTKTTINIGGLETLTATVLPADATNPRLTWESSNIAVATVSDGVVTGIAKGTAVITAKTTDGSDISATCEVTVVNPADIPDTDLSQYSNVLYIESAEGNVGSTVSLSLKMNNQAEVAGFQCDVYVPNGSSIEQDEDDFYLVDLSTARTTAKKTDYFNTALQTDGSVRILCSSTKNYTFSGSEGEVATISLRLGDNMTDDKYPLVLKNIIITDNTGKTYKVDYVKTTLTVSSYTLGDANGDGDINVGDFTCIANYIMGSTPANFVVKAADVNQDSEINVGDLTCVANLVLYGSITPSAGAKGISSDAIVNEVRISNAETSTDRTAEMSIAMENSMPLTGFQFDVEMPQSMSLAPDNVTLSTARTNAYNTDFFSSAMMSDGTIRVLCNSSKSATFDGNSGEVVKAKVSVNDNIASGDYVVTLKNIVLSDAAGNAYKVSDAKAVISVSDVTEVKTVKADSMQDAKVFSVSGMQQASMKKGVNIIKYKDGSTKSIIKK